MSVFDCMLNILILIHSLSCKIVRAVLSGWSTGPSFDLIGPSSHAFKYLCIIELYGAMQLFILIILTSLYLGLVQLALYLVDWPTIVDQWFDTVGWVIWPVRSSPIWTNVFGGTLNHTQLINQCVLLAFRSKRWGLNAYQYWLAIFTYWIF